MLKKTYPFLLLFLFIFLVDGFNSFGQNNRSKKRQIRNKSRKVASFTGNAQKFDNRKQYNGLGLNLSSMNYFGDLTPSSAVLSTDPRFSRPQIGLTYMRRIGTRYTLRGAFAWGRLQGDDFKSQDTEGDAAFRYTRNLHFRNDIKELSVVSMVDLLENRGNYLRRVAVTPYIFGGIAVFHHNPRAKGPVGTEDEGKWVPLRPLQTENKSYSPIQLALPFGIGVRCRLNDDLDLSFEVGYRYTFTDHLDDVSGFYQDPATLKDERSRYFADRSLETIAAYAGKERDMEVVSRLTGVNKGSNRFSSPGEKRGTPNKDVYIVTGIHLTYVFNGAGIFGGKRNAKFR